jgi:maleate cis-trans isomerase
MPEKSPSIGFITPPRWYDPAPSEFLSMAPKGVRTQQTILPRFGFDYALETIAGTGPDLATCARVLAENGCALVAQVGSPFSWAAAGSEEEARGRCQSMKDACGVPVVMTGLAIVDGLRALGAERIAVSCSYYDEVWRDAFSRFMSLAGIQTSHVGTFVDHGVFPDYPTLDAADWGFSADQVRSTLRCAAARAPECQAIVITGAGSRTLALLDEMERELDRPIVAADSVLYWAVLKELGLPAKSPAGAILRSL